MDMFFTSQKLRKRIDELPEFRYQEVQPIEGWTVLEDKTKAEKYPPVRNEEGNAFTLGDTWRGRDYYLWIQTTVTLPNEPGQLFVFDFGKTGGGTNSGFESLCFINGEPYQGVDSNHKEVFLDDTYLGKTIELSLRLWSGLEGGGPKKIQVHTFKQADLARLNTAVDDLYYLGDMVLKTVDCLKEGNPLKHTLLKTLNEAFNLIDWTVPGDSQFNESVQVADDHLNAAIDQMPKDALVDIKVIGHTHIDVAWLWRLKHTREKAARSFSTVLRLMERYPEYKFLQTQPQLYQYIKKDYPEIFEKIKQRVKEGRWEIDGAMWLEADCNIPSGESLTRQILNGSRFMKTEFDKKPNYLWLPDVFGYSWALPQILKKSDIKTFMTTKISWNQYNRMPHDTFIWRGIDGSEVLTHFITTPEPGNNWAKEWFYTYNGLLEPETVLGAYEGYQDKNINQELLISYGFGDGGGGVNRDMLEHRRRMDKIPGLPSVKTALAKDYFDDLHQTVEQTNEFVATWDGELYLEYHRGTYTSQAYVKKTNRKLELALRRLEMLCSFAYWEHPADYPVAQLTTAWESLLRNQFHDIIPGSSIHEVYQDYREEMKQTFEILADVRANLPKAADVDYHYFNSAGWQRDVLVETENTENLGFYDEAGEEVPSVQVGDRQVLLLKEVPAFTTKTLVKKPKGTQPEKPVAIEAASGIETDFYQMKWNSAGQLTSLFDKENDREVLNGLGNVFQLFEDKPINFNAWDIDIFYQEKGREVELGIPKVVENNSLYVELALSGHFNQSMIEQRIRLYAHTRRIDFITNVDWQERQQLLKVKFEVGIRSTQARYDIQYGNVIRPTHWNTSWDMAKFETVAHQWADLSEQNYGVSLLNDSKYGHDIKDHTMRLTLLKGAIDPDPEADLGKHSFTYSLLPHAGDFLAGQTVQEAFEINDVQRLDQGTVVGLPEITFGQHDTVCIDALKQAEDGHGWILRIHDHTGGHRKLEIGIEKGYSWLETNLMERDVTTATKGAIQIDLAPYDIRTMRIFKA